MSEYPALIHNVGDVVTVCRDLEYDKYYNGVWVSDDMLEYRGKELTIYSTGVYDYDEKRIPYYYVEENGFCWTDAMFEDDIVEPVAIDIGDIL